jgi:hypothetical protein
MATRRVPPPAVDRCQRPLRGAEIASEPTLHPGAPGAGPNRVASQATLPETSTEHMRRHRAKKRAGKVSLEALHHEKSRPNVSYLTHHSVRRIEDAAEGDRVMCRLAHHELRSTISVEADMKHRFSTDIVAAAVMVIVAIAVGSLCSTTGKPGDAVAAGIASARGETAPIVLAQYNPCPNGKCR